MTLDEACRRYLSTAGATDIEKVSKAIDQAFKAGWRACEVDFKEQLEAMKLALAKRNGEVKG